jgi:UDP-2,3-diacylglucosamine pyrophosphatase LpxH
VKVRSIFLSDIHLGTRGCQADRLIDFLREFESEHLFLIGDTIDSWAMGRSVQWSATQNTVVQKILRRTRHGEKVVFIPGNHDETLQEYNGTLFGDILIASEWLHDTADGKRLLLIHDDQFDQVTRHHCWLAIM